MNYKGREKYLGEWRNGLKHGQGKYESEKDKISGTWQDGKLVQVNK